ncbi:interleukin-26 [Pseudorasbora parva]|uniref:interleukin-26 n=1 Tax=Pseudorasbora parva TaxID=51549 RepID=UPI00351E0B83
MRIVLLLALCALLCCSLGHKQKDCLSRESILQPLIKEMIHTSVFIQKSLDRDNTPFHRILGNINKCYKKLNVADFKRILELYDEHVFKKLWKNSDRQSIVMFLDSFKRLKNTMERCESEGKKTLSLCAREDLKKFEDTLMMSDQGVQIKAVREFHNVLVWISFSMGRRTHEKIH